MTHTNNKISNQINDLICSSNKIIEQYYTIDLIPNEKGEDFNITVTVSDDTYQLQILQMQLNTMSGPYVNTVAKNLYKKKDEEHLREAFKLLVNRSLKYIQDAILEKIKL